MDPLYLSITESSQAGEARRLSAAMARRLGFNDVDTERVALAVTEAATNLIKHAAGGELLVQPIEANGCKGLEILSLDKGPGMTDPERCVADGYSTAGTMGGGLGAMQRLTETFEIQSAREQGTTLLMRLWSPSEKASAEPVYVVGSVCIPMPRETECGDGWAFEQAEGKALVLVVDGLGHGPLAASAAKSAIEVFRQHAAADLVELMRMLHAGLRPTRGAAAALARIDREKREVQFVGVGNISASIIAGGMSRSMISHNGTVGHEARKIQSFVYEFPKNALLVMHSDGVSNHWRFEQYAGLLTRDPTLIAGVLFRDCRRIRDDATVVVVRESAREAA